MNSLDYEPDPLTLDPARALIGIIMHTPNLGTARRVLAGMRPSDAGDGGTREVFRLVIQAVDADVLPHPVTLLNEARNRGLLDTEHKLKRFSLWLIDTYRAAPAPEAASAIKTDALENALRRALREHGQRLMQLADTAPIDRIHDLAEPSDHLADLHTRHTAASQGHHTTLTEVAA